MTLRERLTLDEGLRLTAYRDTVGKWTIGVGHLLGDEPRMSRITEAEAMALLDADIVTAEVLVQKLVPMIHFDDYTHEYKVRFEALTNMAFNLGNRLGNFVKFLAAVNNKDWDTAAREMLDSVWAGQVGGRARRLADEIRTGVKA